MWSDVRIEKGMSVWNKVKLEIFRRTFLSVASGSTHVADNVADKNISNIPMNVADMLEMLLIRSECCQYA